MSRDQNIAKKIKHIDHFDFRLPCRMYHITYEVVENNNLPLVAEYVLRLLNTMNSVSNKDICEFFGFGKDETSYAIRYLVKFNFASYLEDTVSITSEGKALFNQSKDGLPIILQVRSYTHHFCFDQVSQEPMKKDFLSKYEMKLPEVKIKEEFSANNNAAKIRSSFKKNFEQCLNSLPLHIRRHLRLGPQEEWKNRLCSITKIKSDTIASCLVPVLVEADNHFTNVKVNIDQWAQRISFDSQYAGIKNLQECFHEMTDTVKLLGDPKKQTGQDYLEECLPESCDKRFFEDDTFNSTAYWLQCARQSGQLGRDIQTEMTFGTFWLERNQEKIMSAFDSVNENDERHKLLWLKPSVSKWGRSTGFLEMHSELCNRMATSMNGLAPESYLFSIGENNSASKYMKRIFGMVFSKVVELKPSLVSNDFELLLVPGKLIAVNLYTPMKNSTYPAACGLISIDPETVNRVSSWDVCKEMLRNL